MKFQLLCVDVSVISTSVCVLTLFVLFFILVFDITIIVVSPQTYKTKLVTIGHETKM